MHSTKSKEGFNIRELARRFIPLSFRQRYVQLKARHAEAAGKLYCPVCRSRVRAFLPHGNPPRKDVRCPICHSKACHRLAWVYFSENPDLFTSGGSFLHIAPEPALGTWLRKRCNAVDMEYRKGDIRDRRNFIDLQDTGLQSASVDVIFACHVLNMVKQDELAIREIKRLLKPNGIAVVPVPIQSVGLMKEFGPDSASAARFKSFNDPWIYRHYTLPELHCRFEAVGLAVQSLNGSELRGSDVSRFRLLDESIHIVTRSQIVR